MFSYLSDGRANQVRYVCMEEDCPIPRRIVTKDLEKCPFEIARRYIPTRPVEREYWTSITDPRKNKSAVTIEVALFTALEATHFLGNPLVAPRNSLIGLSYSHSKMGYFGAKMAGMTFGPLFLGALYYSLY